MEILPIKRKLEILRGEEKARPQFIHWLKPVVFLGIFYNKSENVTVFVNLSFDYLLRNHWDHTHGYNFTAPPKVHCGSRISTGMNGIKLISITAEAEDITITRHGIAISKLMIFTD